jgi:alkylated DNA repair protein alkB family protein 6
MSGCHNSGTLTEALPIDLPSSCFYIPSFISPEEEEHILASINQLPTSRWTKLTRRRLLSLPSQLTGTARDILISAPLPVFLGNPVLPRLQELGIFLEAPHKEPNHVLVNEYKPGEGIMPHEDGPAYYPITATVSLGSHTVLEIYKKTKDGDREQTPQWRILQEPRSLLVTTGDMYKDTLHGIAEVEVDEDLNSGTITNWSMLGNTELFSPGIASRETRVSLTYRDVLKVTKLGGAMKFMNKR